MTVSPVLDSAGRRRSRAMLPGWGRRICHGHTGFRHLSWPIRRGRVLDRSAARQSVGGRLVDSWGRRISFEAVPQNGVS